MTTQLEQDLALYMALNYGTEVVPDACGDDDPCYVARHPELRGCTSHGATVDEALANLRGARELYLRTMLENGLRPPRPEQRPTTTLGTGGQPHAPRQVVWEAFAPGRPRRQGTPTPASPFLTEKSPEGGAQPTGSMAPIS